MKKEMKSLHLVIAVGVILTTNGLTEMTTDHEPLVFKSSGLTNMRTTKHLVNSDLQIVLQRTVQEILEGPLAGKTIALYVDDEAEDKISVDYLLAGVETPRFLLKNKLEFENVEAIEDYDATEGEDGLGAPESLYADGNINSETNNRLELLSGSVLLYVTGKMELEAAISAHSSWLISGLLIVSLNNNCKLKSLLQSALAQQTSTMALLCPVVPKSPSVKQETLSFRIFSWLPFHPNKQLVALGAWSASSFPNWKDLFIDRFASFYGSTLHVSSDDSDMPFFFRNPDGTFDGTSKRIMDVLGSKMNFSFTFTRLASDDKWGEEVNGTWVGMLGDVWRGEKDLAVNYFSVTEERAKAFDFSVSHYNEGFGFTIMVPPPLPRWLSLIYPFTMIVWGGVLGALIVMAAIFYLFPHGEQKISVIESVLIIIQSLMNQSVRHLPSSWSLRIFLGVWWLSSYIIVLSYTCNLIAVLTVPVFPTKIQTVQQLAKSDYRVCMLDYGEFVPEALASSEDAQLYALGSKLDMVPTSEDEEYFGEEGCVELVLKGSHAHVETYSYVQLVYIELGHSNVVYFPKEQIYKANLAFFFRKNTPWKYKFDEGIHRVVESGLVIKWYSDIMDEIRRKGTKASSEALDLSLSLGHLQGPFFILLFGDLFAAIIFALEWLRR